MDFERSGYLRSLILLYYCLLVCVFYFCLCVVCDLFFTSFLLLFLYLSNFHPPVFSNSMLKISKTCSINALSCDLVYIYCLLGEVVCSALHELALSATARASLTTRSTTHIAESRLFISTGLELDSVDDRRGVEPEKDYKHVSTRLWVGTFDLAAVRRLAVANAL